MKKVLFSALVMAFVSLSMHASEWTPSEWPVLKHYDQNGHKTGESRWGLFGSLNHYDEKGKKTGHSDRGIFGDWKDYDESR